MHGKCTGNVQTGNAQQIQQGYSSLPRRNQKQNLHAFTSSESCEFLHGKNLPDYGVEFDEKAQWAFTITGSEVRGVRAGRAWIEAHKCL